MPKARFHLDLSESADLTLKQAVLIYRSTARGHARSFASIHEVSMQTGRPTILAGKPATPRAVMRLAHALSCNSAQAGYLPGNVLYVDGGSLVWWTPPQSRHIAFRCPEAVFGERSAVVPHPALVFMVTGTTWHVWAHKGRQRPRPDSVLWRAPYFNVGADGAICRGNVATPTGTTTDKMGAWEDAFFRSYFTHPNLPSGLVRHPGGAYAFWSDMIDRTPASFPQRALVSAGATLGELVGRLAHGRH